MLRILRVFKLARHNTGLQVLVKTGMAARHELGQVLFCFSISVVLFAAVVFYTEEHVTVPYDKPFTSVSPMYVQHHDVRLLYLTTLLDTVVFSDPPLDVVGHHHAVHRRIWRHEPHHPSREAFGCVE